MPILVSRTNSAFHCTCTAVSTCAPVCVCVCVCAVTQCSDNIIRQTVRKSENVMRRHILLNVLGIVQPQWQILLHKSLGLLFSLLFDQLTTFRDRCHLGQHWCNAGSRNESQLHCE
jgi:hypothetical protein